MTDLLLKVLEFEGGEKAKGTQVERHYGRDALLEQGRGVQERSVPAQADHEVDLVGEVVLALREGHQLVLDLVEQRVLRQQVVVHHCSQGKKKYNKKCGFLREVVQAYRH
jgi:hypothetical protein